MSSAESTEIMVLVAANAVAVTLYVIGYIGGGGKAMNNFKDLLLTTGQSGVTLLPALSVFVLEDTPALMYAGVGAGVWGIALALGASKKCNLNGDASCTKGQMFLSRSSAALHNVAASLWVGALLAYVRDLKL